LLSGKQGASFPRKRESSTPQPFRWLLDSRLRGNDIPPVASPSNVTATPERHLVNIIDPILAQCRFQPDAPALCAPGEPHATIAYGQLGKLINNVARHTEHLGLRRGDTVVLYVQDMIGHAVLILGLAKAGVITISGRGPELPAEIKVDAVVADIEGGLPSGKRVIHADASLMAGDGAALTAMRGAPGGDEVCRIVFTSGTTGEPKGVAFTHRMVASRIARFDYLAGNALPANLRCCVDLGLSTSLGYYYLIYGLTRGGLVVLPGASQGNAMNACDFHDVRYWIGAPGGLAALLAFYEESKGRRCNFHGMLAGGSLLLKPLSERVRARMCASLISAYGSTETHMVATAPSHLTAEVPGAVGYLTPGLIVEAVDATHRPLPPGDDGLIRIFGPYNVKAYIGASGETAAAFRDGWFYPGDIGSVTRDNMLIITGRQKTIMNIGGDKVSPEMIESTLMAFPGVDRAGVLSVVNDVGIEEIWAALASRDVNEAQLRALCQGLLPPAFMPRRFIRIDEIPTNEMGKIDRRRLAERLHPRKH
jgi:acyl-CoA synthetase (AMP-forming)/AMP-acid ligase II